MEEPMKGEGKQSFVETVKRLTIDAVFAAGIAFLGFVTVILILTILPKSGPKTAAFRTLEMDFVRDLWDFVKSFNGGAGATPDSPIVVRGGSVDIFSNISSAGWQQLVGSNYLFQADAQELPNTLYLDGVALGTGPHSAEPGPVTLSPTYNWTIALTMRPDDGGTSTSTVYICSQLTDNKQTCNLSPTGTLASGGKTDLYFEGNHSAPYPKPIDFDRKGASGNNARLHSPVANCNLGTDADGTPDPYADKQCDKIDYFVFYQGSGSSAGTKYWCIDGACDIKIGRP
jgi:hypothetical protein